ncbi:MAG: PIN domain-containing protein [Actinobacteria bacterium]|nr:MAG: PIN domain-containing protein [Actinomycetota bacterium]
MTASVCVDSCVAFKWFAPAEEPGLGDALGLLHAHRDGEIALVAPSIMRVEVANALRYSGCGIEILQGAIQDLTRFHIEYVEPDDGILSRAGGLALEHGLSVYDAMFLALAIEREGVLVSADRKAFGRIPASVCEIRLL